MDENVDFTDLRRHALIIEIWDRFLSGEIELSDVNDLYWNLVPNEDKA